MAHAPRRFDGKTALITGASSGMGAATALLLAEGGAALMLLGRDAERLSLVAERARALGAPAVRTRTVEVASTEEMAAAFAAAVEDLGPIDVVFANAGMTGPGAAFAEYPEDAFTRVIDVDLKGVFITMKLALLGMLPRRSGSIIVTGSLASQRGLPGSAAYNAAKHGVLGLVRTAAVEYGSTGVRINAVLPGLVDTPLVWDGADSAGLDAAGRERLVQTLSPLKRPAQPREVAEVVAFLASDAASFVNGAMWSVDAGAYAGVGTAP